MVNLKSLRILTIVLIGGFIFSGCESLHKKFVRQKKKDALVNNDFIPVLEPQEYPRPEEDPATNYAQHYAMVKVWYKDLDSFVNEMPSDDAKSARYALDQVTLHLGEMRKLVVPDQQLRLKKLYDLLEYYGQALGQGRAFRNYGRMQSDLRAFDRYLRDQASVAKMKDVFVAVSAK